VQVLGDRDLVRSDAASGLVVANSGRLVALIGVDDVVVVDTADALLVTTRAHAQEVKAMVDRLRDTGRADLT
jgi:mannose-1-phosphate guanylyltransferase